MTNMLHVQIDRIDGSLQRLIGLVERRGFHIDGIDMVEQGAFRNVTMKVRSRDASRSLDNLGLQIDRLVGARRISNDAAFRSEAA